jgi:hypothetical protein
MKKIISKVQYYFEKIKSNKRLMYMFCTTILVLFCLALNIAFSAFSQTTINAAANIKVKNMEFSMTINGENDTIIAASANDVRFFNLMVMSLNNRNAKYELYYHVCSDQNCTEYITKPDGLTIDYSTKSTDTISGTINTSGSKSIRIVTTNTTSTTYYLKLDINAGYSYNTLALKNLITTEYEESDLTVIAYVNGTLATSFPTQKLNYECEVKCTTNGGASNATGVGRWDGTQWLVNVENVNSSITRCNASFYDIVSSTDNSGANAPNIATNMIPVRYDNVSDTWKKASATQVGWYDYSHQAWANAVTVTSSTRSTYNSAAVGTEISMSDILGMWVWIPRYEYMTTNLGTSYAGGTQALPGGISIKFISGTSTTNDTNYLIHPAFRNGTTSYTLPNGSTASNYSQGGWDKELTGFWMGKFETGYSANNAPYTSSISSNILIKPDVYSMKYQIVSDQYTTAANIQSDHGIGSTVETHMSKNDEWGAVAYLSQSIYGKYGNASYQAADKEIYANNAEAPTSPPIYTTGRSNGTYGGGSGSGITDYGTYEYDNCPASTYSYTSCTEIVRNTNNTKGTGASTTGNIYGVYDMSGGAWEHVMANLNGTISSSGFSSMPAQKYWNKYTSTTTSSACNGSPCYGQAMTETGTGSNGATQWYNDFFYFFDSSSNYNKWVTHGNSSGDGVGAHNGIFDFCSFDGSTDSVSGFRASIS